MEKEMSTITRQQAEIERYKRVIKILEKDVATAKSEAVKEFAERLKQFLLLNREGEISVIAIENINCLVKETVGESDE